MSDWQTIKLRVETPMFCGAADKEPEVRVSSIKGEIRFWLRAILGGALGDNLDLIAEVESSLLGSTERSSKVAFRIPQQPESQNRNQSTNFHRDLNSQYGDFKGLAYMLGQGLCEYRTTTGSFHLTRDFIPIGATFELKMRFTRERKPAETALLQWAMWATFNLGGVGARNRRGFGRLRVIDCSPELDILHNNPPKSILSNEALAQVLEKMHTTATQAALEVLMDRCPSAVVSDGPALFPSLSSLKWHVSPIEATPIYSAPWNRAFSEAGLDLRKFRAGEDAPEARYDPKLKTHEWLHVLNNPRRSHFPLGTFGLPIVFKPNKKVTAFSGDEELRWPSPLFLTLIDQGDQYRLVSLFFITQFLPEAAGEKPTLKYVHGRDRRILQTRDQDAVLLAKQWFDFVDGKPVNRLTAQF